MEKEIGKNDNPFMKIRQKSNKKNNNEVQIDSRWANIEFTPQYQERGEKRNPFKNENRNKRQHYSKFLRFTDFPKEKKEEKKEFNIKEMENDFPELSSNN